MTIAMTQRLFCPGPTPVPMSVHVAAALHPLYHRGSDFQAIMRQVATALHDILGCDGHVLLLASSGTGAMEAAMANLTAPRDEIVVVRGGKFGERWEKLGAAYGCQVRTIAVPWGTAPSLVQLTGPGGITAQTRAIFLQMVETSTGTWFDAPAIARSLRAQGYDGLIVADGISSILAHPANFVRDDGIDCMVGASQKGFGVPPGLAFAALSQRALALVKPGRSRSFYFDFSRELKAQKDGQTAWTPAISLLQQMAEAVRLINERGIDETIARHGRIAKAVRAAVTAMGLTLFSESPCDAVTAIRLPDGLDGKAVVRQLRDRYSMVFAGGQDQLEGKIVRMAHMGFVDAFDVLAGVGGLEFALHDEFRRVGRASANPVGTGCSAFTNSIYSSIA